MKSIKSEVENQIRSQTDINQLVMNNNSYQELLREADKKLEQLLSLNDELSE